MKSQPGYRVFLSATSAELGSYREELARVLQRKTIEVREQASFRQGNNTLLNALN